MDSLAITALVFACVVAGAGFGIFLRRVLPEDHLNADSRDVVKLGMGLVATLTALVLGLLIATAKGTFDTQSSSVKELATKVVLLDRILATYGPETKDARESLRASVEGVKKRLWSNDRAPSLAPGESRAPLEVLYDKIGELSPQNDKQRTLKARAMDLTVDLGQSRLRLLAQEDTSLPTPFFVVLVFWLAVLFTGYAVLAPCHSTVVVVLVICALSVSAAVFLTIELTTPFNGTILVSSVPLNEALSLIGQ